MQYRVENQLSFPSCISDGNPFRSRMIEWLSDALLPPPSDITDKSILRRMFRAAASAYGPERNGNEYRRVRVLRKLHGKKRKNERTTRQRWGVCIREDYPRAMTRRWNFSRVIRTWGIYDATIGAWISFSALRSFSLCISNYTYIYVYICMYEIYVRSTRKASGQGKGGARYTATFLSTYVVRSAFLYVRINQTGWMHCTFEN